MKKKLFITISIIIITLATNIFFIPYFFSSKVGISYIKKRVEKKTNSFITIDNLTLNWFGPQIIKNLSYKDKNIDLKVDKAISNMSLFSFYKSLKSYKKIKWISNTQIDNFNISFSYPSLLKASFENVNISIKANLKGLNSIKIFGDTSSNNLKGNFQIDIHVNGENILSKISGKNIPTLGLDHLFFYKNKNYKNLLTTFLGQSFNIEIDSNLKDLKGPISIDLSSKLAKTNLNLLYEKNLITLLENATLVFNLQNENSNFLKKIDYIESFPNHPIILRIFKNGFSIPINPFKLENLKISNATLDLNKLKISNTGPIKKITSIAKMHQFNFAELWFTYVNLSLLDGILTTDRADILINDILHICIWGKANLINKNLHMYLGIPQDTLENVFNIQYLPDHYVIKIPIKGTLDDPKIDASSATAKIIALSTLQSSHKIGSIIGSVITGLQKEDKSIPKAKRPFPWEGKEQKNQSPPRLDINEIFDFFK